MASSDERPPAEPAHDPNLVEAVRKMELAVDAVYINAMSVTRLVGLGPPDIPRLCVMAGCRMVERMIESYREARAVAEQIHGASDGSGTSEPVAAQLERRKVEIGKALEQLVGTLADGLTTSQHLQKSIGVKVNVQ